MGCNSDRWDLKKGIRVGGMETKQRRRKNADEAENWCLMPPVDQRPSRNVDCVWSILFASRKGNTTRHAHRIRKRGSRAGAQAPGGGSGSEEVSRGQTTESELGQHDTE